jgi:hypothetical protein
MVVGPRGTAAGRARLRVALHALLSAAASKVLEREEEAPALRGVKLGRGGRKVRLCRDRFAATGFNSKQNKSGFGI